MLFNLGTVTLIFICCLFITSLRQPVRCSDFCMITEDGKSEECLATRAVYKNSRFIFYDVNPSEGFNLRRDVYLRMAVFVKKLQKLGNFFLVLPPWPHLYHWQSPDISDQARLPWNLFFDIPSLNDFVPVMEMFEYFETKNKQIDDVYILQHFKDTFETGNFEDRMMVDSCSVRIPYYLNKENSYTGPFWGYSNISGKNVQCLSFHGPVTQLTEIAEDKNSVMFDHAEVALHHRFGDRVYWEARRSMRFSKELVHIADIYRKTFLNSTDETDVSIRPMKWKEETERRTAKGGPYMCVHLRRKDFLRGRPKDVPSLYKAAQQIKNVLEKWGLDTVFVATDAPQKEITQLKNFLKGINLFVYDPSVQIKEKYKDGGIAIIEQIICSHSRVFYGTHESTFSFRIQEEREIMGFPSDSSFNRLCGDNDEKCTPPSKWKIVF